MHCQVCGAPIGAIDSTGHYRCRYCDTIANVKVVDETLDRIKLTVAETAHSCTKCHVPLVDGSVDESPILGCPSCFGFLIEQETFGYVARNRRAGYQGADATPKPLDPDELNRKIGCPTCSRQMECHAYCGPGSVVIDSCMTCRMVWLDAGELTKIEQAPGRRGAVETYNVKPVGFPNKAPTMNTHDVDLSIMLFSLFD